MKHALELIYVPELVSKDIKLKDAKQSTSKEPMFTSKTKGTRKNLSDLDIELNKGKDKIEEWGE